MTRWTRFVVAASAIVFAVAAVSPSPALAGTYKRDLYRSSLYERQIDSRTCVPASVAMMLNMTARRDLGLSQRAILRYAQPRDALDDAVQRGTDGLGWAKAATYYSPRAGDATRYRVEAYATESGALRRAARQIATYGKAVGVMTAHGRHAMVLTGFEATANPAAGSFRLLRVWISDPYGYWHRSYDPAATPLDPYLELDATDYWDDRWYGKYVIVVPLD
jgi:hypothetical protein